MGQQTIKQRARQQALDVAARHRRERAEREKRLQNLTTTCLTAILERDQFVAVTEQRAGDALREITEVEGLTLREASEWCGISVREATRLRQLAAADASGEQPGEGEQDAAEAADADAGDAVTAQDGGVRAGTAAE